MHQSATQKTWKTKNGAVACSPKSAVNDGMGILYSFLPYREPSEVRSEVVSERGERNEPSGGFEEHGYGRREKVTGEVDVTT